MEVIEFKKQPDGSVTLTLDLTENENQLLVEKAINDFFKDLIKKIERKDPEILNALDRIKKEQDNIFESPSSPSG